MMRLILWTVLFGGFVVTTAQAQPARDPAPPKPLTNDLSGPRANVPESSSTERAKLMSQLQELLQQINARRPLPSTERPPIGPKGRPTSVGPTPPSKFDVPGNLKPTDGLRIGTNLFRDNDFDGALRTFKLIDTFNMAKEDRAFVQYMTASCLRRLNRPADAAAILRDVAEAKDDEFLAECALSQLSLIRSGQELEAQIEQLRSRPKSK